MLLPLYTTLLSSEEYGTVDLITTLVQLFIPLTSLMIDQEVFRFLLSCDNKTDKTIVISNSFILLTGSNVCFFLLYEFMASFVSVTFQMWFFLILVVTSYNNLFLQIARGLKQTHIYAFGSFMCSAVIIVLNVIFTAYFLMGAQGMLFATFMGNFISCFFLTIKLRIYKYISFEVIHLKVIIDKLKYSVPLIPNQLSIWVMNSSDRIIVAYVLGTAANGILAVSHKFPAIFMTFFNIFQLAWHETGVLHYFDNDRDNFFSETFEKIIKIFSTLCIGIIAVLPLTFNWFINISYNDAYNNIPIYMAALLFNVVVGLLGVVYVATKRTLEIAKTTLLSATINIIINILLIDKIGLIAASISTFIGYLIAMLYRIIDTKKYINIKYNAKQYLAVGFCLVIYIFIYYLKNKFISVIFFPLFIILAVYINKDVIEVVIKFVKSKVG